IDSICQISRRVVVRALLICFVVLLALLPATLSEAQLGNRQDISTTIPMDGKMTIRCYVQGAGGIAVYVAEWNAIFGIASIWLEYETAGFYSTTQARWNGLYRWYILDLFTSGVGHAASGQCSGR
ncbi:MAG: hypothetical protein OXH48_06795, partial [Chloroflexi bacterium]|nr:hypothetical protein [Chloroflexota bacterium]